jgi:hypothetical protein
MRSIADDLRRESMRALAGLTAAERVALALRLGDEDVALHRSAHGITERESRAALKRARAIGRIPSRSNDSDLP